MDVGSLVVVTQDFISELEEELSLFAGDIVQISEIIGKLWLRGESNGCEGKLPRSYVREKPLPSNWNSKDSTLRLYAALADFSAVQEGDLGFCRGECLPQVSLEMGPRLLSPRDARIGYDCPINGEYLHCRRSSDWN